MFEIYIPNMMSVLADDDRDSLEDDDRFEEYYHKEEFEDIVEDVRYLFIPSEIQFVAERAAEEHNFYDWEFGQVIPNELLDYNVVRNARADLEVQQQLGDLDLAAPEVQIPVPQYLPHGVTLDDYVSGDYREYRR